MSERLTQFEVTVANMLEDVTIQPEPVKALFAKLTELRPVANQIDTSIQQTQESLKRLYDQQAKMAGSFETLMQLIEAAMPKEAIEQYGKQLKSQTPNK